MDNSLLNWSLKLYRTSTLEVRASWLLGVWMLFDAVWFVHLGLWLLIPFAFLVPLLSMYIHAIAHVTMARLVGGSADRTVLSMINDRGTLIHARLVNSSGSLTLDRLIDEWLMDSKLSLPPITPNITYPFLIVIPHT